MSHKALEMVPLEQSKWIPKLRLLSHGFNVEIKLRMKWLGSIWIALNRWRNGHRPLDDGFWSKPEGRWESVRAWESGCACLDVSPGLEVLALFGGIRQTDDSGGGEVGGLRVKYQRWGGLEGMSPSEDGTVGAWKARDESRGAEELGLASRDTNGSVWPPLMRAMAEMGREAEVASSNWWPRGVEWQENNFTRWC